MELDLAPRSNFFMWVRAYNKGGPGRPSDVFVISTLNGTSYKIFLKNFNSGYITNLKVICEVGGVFFESTYSKFSDSNSDSTLNVRLRQLRLRLRNRGDIIQRKAKPPKTKITLTPAHLQTSTSAHLQTPTPAHLQTPTPAHLQTPTPAHLQTPTPAHLKYNSESPSFKSDSDSTTLLKRILIINRGWISIESCFFKFVGIAFLLFCPNKEM